MGDWSYNPTYRSYNPIYKWKGAHLVRILAYSKSHDGTMGGLYIYRSMNFVDFYGINVAKYTSSMDPLGIGLKCPVIHVSRVLYLIFVGRL